MMFFDRKHFCVLCRKYKSAKTMSYVAGGVGMCKACEEKLYQFSDNSFEAPGKIKAVFSAYLYEGALREAVKSLKFSGQEQFGVLFGKILAEKLGKIEVLKRCDIIIPVPLYPSRQAERGYNQSEIIANVIASSFEIPMVTDVLFRIRDTKKQSTLKGLERMENVKDAFVAHSSVKDKKIILVDDICTMGATLKACEEALRIEGSGDVYAITLCVSPEK